MLDRSQFPDLPELLGQPVQVFRSPPEGSFIVRGIKSLFGQGGYVGWTVIVCEKGLASRDHRPGASDHIKGDRDILWTDIVSIRTSMSRFIKGFFSTDFEFHILELPDGNTFDLTSALKDISPLGELVQEKVFSRLLPAQVAAFRAGQAVNFGPVEVSPAGLKFRDELLPWDSIGTVTIQNGKFLVERSGPGAALEPLAAAEIKNLRILWTLLGEKLGPRRLG